MVRTVMNKTDLFKELEEYLRHIKSNIPQNTGHCPLKRKTHGMDGSIESVHGAKFIEILNKHFINL